MMSYLKSTIAIVVLATFLLTMRSRLYDAGVVPAGDYVTATVAPVARWFVLPAPLRPEEGFGEMPAVDGGVRPAYTIAAIVNAIAVVAVASHDALPEMVSRTIGKFPLALPVFLIGIAVVVNCVTLSSKAKKVQPPATENSKS